MEEIIIESVNKFSPNYCIFAYSALTCFRIGMSGSASFQMVRKSWNGQSVGIETSRLLEWDAIKVPVGGFFAESVAGAVRAGRNGSLQHLRGDCT
jgi:hypothetical protein